MDKRVNPIRFAALMELFDLETIEILGDAKFAVEVVRIAKRRKVRP